MWPRARCSAALRQRWLVLLALILLGSLASPAAAEFPRALDIIRQAGQLIFSDGSSYYLFDGDGTFDSGPTAISDSRDVEAG